jgi:hypothetical protein
MDSETSMFQVTSVDGRRWGLLHKANPDYPEDEDLDTDEDPDFNPIALVQLGKNPEGPHHAYVLADVTMRGGEDYFYYCLDSHTVFHAGHPAPNEPSDGIVFCDGWENTPPIPEGNYYRVQAVGFNLEELSTEVKKEVGMANWRDSWEPPDSSARDVIDGMTEQ